jgi:hypothetical protein
MPIDRGFINNSNQKERRAQLSNDRQVNRDDPQTLHQRAQQTIGDEMGGRFRRYTEQNIVGSKPIPQYPKIESGPWSRNDAGTELEPFPFDINYVDIGNPSEPSPPSLEPTQAAAPVPPVDGSVAGSALSPSKLRRI